MNQIFSISFYFVFFFFEPIEALKIKIISTRILKSKRAHVYNVNNETKFVSIKTL